MLVAAGTGVSMSFGPKIGSEGGWTNAKKVLFSQLLLLCHTRSAISDARGYSIVCVFQFLYLMLLL